MSISSIQSPTQEETKRLTNQIIRYQQGSCDFDRVAYVKHGPTDSDWTRDFQDQKCGNSRCSRGLLLDAASVPAGMVSDNLIISRNQRERERADTNYGSPRQDLGGWQ